VATWCWLLSDNGSAYIDHRTRRFARELDLEPLTTPVRSPQSDGMAESFVKTMKPLRRLYGRAWRTNGARASGSCV
jgi:transposase InsO family protein